MLTCEATSWVMASCIGCCARVVIMLYSQARSVSEVLTCTPANHSSAASTAVTWRRHALLCPHTACCAFSVPGSLYSVGIRLFSILTSTQGAADNVLVLFWMSGCQSRWCQRGYSSAFKACEAGAVRSVQRFWMAILHAPQVPGMSRGMDLLSWGCPVSPVGARLHHWPP